MADPFLAILQLSDSLFPLGSFAYSDGLEAAVVRTFRSPRNLASAREQHAAGFLREWMDTVLSETIGRTDGPIVWSAWAAFQEEQWDSVVSLDEEATALRPASAARRASRAMGLRLLTTWSTLHPDPRLERALARARAGDIGPALPVAFAGACACAQIDRRRAVEVFAYSRLAATISAAMRLMPIGQTQAQSLLARALETLPAVVDAIERRNAEPESFAPALDIECMSHQYLHSRLFRS